MGAWVGELIQLQALNPLNPLIVLSRTCALLPSRRSGAGRNTSRRRHARRFHRGHPRLYERDEPLAVPSNRMMIFPAMCRFRRWGLRIRMAIRSEKCHRARCRIRTRGKRQRRSCPVGRHACRQCNDLPREIVRAAPPVCAVNNEVIRTAWGKLVSTMASVLPPSG